MLSPPGAWVITRRKVEETELAAVLSLANQADDDSSDDENTDGRPGPVSEHLASVLTAVPFLAPPLPFLAPPLLFLALPLLFLAPPLHFRVFPLPFYCALTAFFSAHTTMHRSL